MTQSNYRLLLGDCEARMKELSDNSVDSIITDPPYGLSACPDIATVMQHWIAGDKYSHNSKGFMGKEWDSFVPDPHIWKEAFRVLKPGGIALVFAGTRTVDLMSISLRFANFQIRDMIFWCYGSGFPKSMNLGDGYGTALKPALEPIIVAMKDLDGTYKQNFEKWGVAGFNIDTARIGERFPANLILDEEAAEMLDEQTGILKSGSLTPEQQKNGGFAGTNGIYGTAKQGGTGTYESSSGGASRFFYVAKASTKERSEGLEHLEAKKVNDGRTSEIDNALTERLNIHPTVKPIKLMEYLCKLTKTPTGGVVLDPFMGSGTTGIAAHNTGRDFIGIELAEDYFKIAKARIEHHQSKESSTGILEYFS